MSRPATDSRDLILAIDAGTQSIRAAIVDLSGDILSLVKLPLNPCAAPHPGWAEQDPDYYWNTLCAACKSLFNKSPGLRNRIAGLAVTTQRGTVVNVDREGAPLRPAITWLDERKADAAMPAPLRGLLKMLKYHDLVDGVVRDCEARWIMQNQPEIWERTHKLLFLSGYFNYRLTGEFADSAGSIVGYVPFNIKSGQWSGARDPRRRLFPIDNGRLPRLAQPADTLGRITRAAAAQTGIPEGLPVIAAASDKACEILGAGCTSPETACICFGTISTLNTQNSRYVEIRPFWPPFPSAVPGQFYTEFSVMRGAWMITWFKEEFGLQEQLEAADRDVTPEQLLDVLIQDIPAGSLGLVLQPYWSPAPDKARCARGSIIGFRDAHKRAHLYRAILEGLVFALKEGAQLTQKKNRVPMTALRVSGGGSQSDSVMQICADIFGLSAQRPHTHETSLLGAAMDAAVGLGLHPDFSSAISAMCRPGRTFEPIPANADIYKQLYERIYLKMYKQLLPLFRDLQDITNPPAPEA